MSQRKSSLMASCFLPIVALLVLGAIYLAVNIMTVPAQAEKLFGPAHAGLGGWQRYWLSAQLLLDKNDLIQALNPLAESQQFHIELGESTAAITRQLEASRLIPNAGAVRNYLVYSGLDTGLQAGDHLLSASMTPLEIAHTLQNATPGEVAFVILAGWRVDEIAAILPTSGLEISPKAFTSAVLVHPSNFQLEGEYPAHATMEGFLFPDTYRLPRDLSAPGLIQALLERFQSQVTNDIRQGFESQGLTLYQALTLASIIEREAVVDDEMPQIASVFLNRLAAGMKLDSDPTVQYALGYSDELNTWWKNPLRTADLQVESLYNTYIYAGLPPGPISNPGIAALQAVAFPAQTPYYYFRARCDSSGKHEFAETFEEHLQNACP